MTNILNRFIAALFVALVFPFQVPAQDASSGELRFAVDRVYPYISITRQELMEANTLSELNRHYKPSWVKEYISVEVSTTNHGRSRKAAGKNETLTVEQKDIMNNADAGTEISVEVRYIPDNTLKHNDVKELKFSFTIDPDQPAKYTGGQHQLKQYIKAMAIDRISPGSFDPSTLAAVKFAIDVDGSIIDAHVFETSRDKDIDALLLKTISSMPKWEPAKYNDGTKVKQEFVLTVGNMESCVINLLNIRQS